MSDASPGAGAVVENAGDERNAEAQIITPTAPLPGSDSLNLHALLLLADSALPLGSFAYSAGLESHLAHLPKRDHGLAAIRRFLLLSLSSAAATVLPYVVAAHAAPGMLAHWDNELDASTACVVARRASVKQGSALLGVWEKSLRGLGGAGATAAAASLALDNFGLRVKAATRAGGGDPFPAQGHLAPVFGATCAAAGLGVQYTCHVFLLNHAKTVASAAVRAGAVGPYAAQGLLAGGACRETVARLAGAAIAAIKTRSGENHDNLDTIFKRLAATVEAAGQNVPLLDVWGGRHEMLYSRIFNS